MIKIKNCNVSVDMINLVIDIKNFEFDKYIKPFLSRISNKNYIDYWSNLSFKKYRHNWRVEGRCEDDENRLYSFFVAYSLNISEEYKNRLLLSYNPNKVDSDDDVLWCILDYMKMNSERVLIHSADIAYDYLGISTDEIVVDKSYKKTISYNYYPGSCRTIYLGKAGLGQIKIYDKASELKIKNKKMTRYEITLDIKTYFNDFDRYEIKETFPIFYLKTENVYMDIEETDFNKLLLYSVASGYDINKLDSRNKKKYSKLISKYYPPEMKIAPKSKEGFKALHSFLNSIL